MLQLIGEGVCSPYSKRLTTERRLIYELMLSSTNHDIELRALPSRYRVITRSVEKMEWFVRHNWWSNLYFGVYTREGGGRAEHVREGIWLFADLDFKGYEGGETEALSYLETFEFKPTLLIHSGGGYHAYWMLDETIMVDERNTRGILLGIADALKSDRAVCDIARILRIPGTYNFKYDPPRLCHIVSYDQDRRYSLSDFMKYWVEPEEKNVYIRHDGSQPIPEGDYSEVFLPYLKVARVDGDEIIAFCIFHDDRNTPNLGVNLKTGVYHCLRCGRKGNAFTFKTEISRRIIAGGN